MAVAARPLRVVLYEDKMAASWIAQCVDIDVCAFAPDPENAVDRLHQSIAAELALFNGSMTSLQDVIGPAPQEYFAFYDNSDPVVLRGSGPLRDEAYKFDTRMLM